MIIQRLSWAGILIKFKQTTIHVDPLYHINTEFFGYPHETFYPFHHLGHIDAVLITHLHSDHFDPKAIASFLGSDIPVYVPKASLKEAQRSILNNIIGVEINNIITCGSLEITATHSVDGLGDPNRLDHKSRRQASDSLRRYSLAWILVENIKKTRAI